MSTMPHRESTHRFTLDARSERPQERWIDRVFVNDLALPRTIVAVTVDPATRQGYVEFTVMDYEALVLCGALLKRLTLQVPGPDGTEALSMQHAQRWLRDARHNESLLTSGGGFPTAIVSGTVTLTLRDDMPHHLRNLIPPSILAR